MDCDTCGRAMAACEWCGTSDLRDGMPVVRRAEWAGGTYHETCRQVEQSLLRPRSGASSRSSAR